MDPALLAALLVGRDPDFEDLLKGEDVTIRAFEVLRIDETVGSS